MHFNRHLVTKQNIVSRHLSSFCTFLVYAGLWGIWEVFCMWRRGVVFTKSAVGAQFTSDAATGRTRRRHILLLNTKIISIIEIVEYFSQNCRALWWTFKSSIKLLVFYVLILAPSRDSFTSTLLFLYSYLLWKTSTTDSCCFTSCRTVNFRASSWKHMLLLWHSCKTNSLVSVVSRTTTTILGRYPMSE